MQASPPSSTPVFSREVLRLLTREIDGFVRRRVIAAVVIALTAAVLTGLAPVAFKLLVDAFAGAPAGQPVPLWHLLLLYVGCQWLARTLNEVRYLVFARAEQRMTRALSERLFSHVMRLPLRFHLDRRTGAVSQALANGMQGFQIVAQQAVFTVLPVIGEVATVAFVLVELGQPVFLVILVLSVAAYAFVFWHGVLRLHSSADAISTAYVDAQAVMTDSILNYETVKYFSAEGLVRERFDGALSQTERQWLQFFRHKATNGIWIATVCAVSLAVTIGYAARGVQNGTLTLGDFVLINTYLLQIVRPVEMLGFGLQQLSQGFAFLGKMVELFEQKPEPGNPEAAGEPAQAIGRLDFENVSLAYRTGRQVLREVSFTVPSGKTLGIVGASGAGKSSLVRLLVRLFEPDEGRILLDGAPIADMPLASLRRAIAVVPQDTVLFNDTIGYNIAFGRPGCSHEDVEHAARLAHLHELIARLPEGYDTLVGERGVKLSGGEKQRVSIARAALKAPRIYVFDEATSSLDSTTEGEILRNLHELSRDATTLVIAHRLSTVVHAHEIIVLDDGLVVERGNHAELLRRGGRYAQLWEAQQGEMATKGTKTHEREENTERECTG